MKAGICIGLMLWCCSCLCYGQVTNPSTLTPNPSWQDFLSSLTMDSETMDSEAWQEYISSLEDLHDNPLDINTATPEEMAEIPFLTPEQIEAIQAYVHLDGPMKTLGELLLIPEIDIETRRILPFFFTIKPLDGKFRHYLYQDTDSASLKHGTWNYLKREAWNLLKPTGTTIDSRLEVPLYNRRGQLEGQYAGDGLYNRLRVNIESQKLQVGFHAEKDAGERWYDSYGGYAMYQGKGILKQIVGGDYRAGWGEGLVMSSRTLSLKSTNGTTPSQGIRPMKSTSEYTFLRGAALTIGSKNSNRSPLTSKLTWQASGFISYQSMDATLTNEGYAKTIVTTGYHRTATEIAKKGNTPTLIMGGHAQIGWKHLIVGTTGLFQHYERPLAPGDQAYRRYYPTGYDIGNIGLHASYNHYRINTAGEIAYNFRDVALTGRLGYTFSRKFRATLSGRYFGKAYYSSQASATSESSTVRNEAGGMLNIHAQPFRLLTNDAYIDIFCDLWPRYLMTHTSYGQEFMLQNTLTTSKAGTWALRYLLKRKEASDKMQTHHKIQLYNILQPWERFRFKTTVNLHIVQTPETSGTPETTALGYALTENFQSRLLKHQNLRINVDASWFDTPNYLSRVYLNQTTLWSSFSYLMCYGKGVSSALYVRYTTPNERWMFEVRYSLVHRLDVDTQGSNYQTIYSPTKQDISLQARFKI